MRSVTWIQFLTRLIQIFLHSVAVTTVKRFYRNRKCRVIFGTFPCGKMWNVKHFVARNHLTSWKSILWSFCLVCFFFPPSFSHWTSQPRGLNWIDGQDELELKCWRNSKLQSWLGTKMKPGLKWSSSESSTGEVPHAPFLFPVNSSF